MSVDSDVPASTDLFGKSVTDLQENVTIGSNAITGTLKHVTDYTGFSSDTELQSGNYLVLHCEAENADKITVELVGGTKGPVTLDDDGIIVIRITDPATQTVKVVCTNEHKKYTKVYTLSGLTLES